VRIIRNTWIHSVGRMKSCLTLMQVVRTVTAHLQRIHSAEGMSIPHFQIFPHQLEKSVISIVALMRAARSCVAMGPRQFIPFQYQQQWTLRYTELMMLRGGGLYFSLPNVYSVTATLTRPLDLISDVFSIKLWRGDPQGHHSIPCDTVWKL
jgi:hypothetical protein